MTILAAVDGEQIPSPTIEEAYELARRLDEELVVVHVMPQDAFDEIKSSLNEDQRPVLLAPGISYVDQSTQASGNSASTERSYSIEDGEKAATDVAREVLETTLDEWSDVSLQGRVGEPVTETLAEVDRRDARYLVIGGRKRTPVGKAIFGSLTQSFLLNADRPVLTVMQDS